MGRGGGRLGTGRGHRAGAGSTETDRESCSLSCVDVYASAPGPPLAGCHPVPLPSLGTLASTISSFSSSPSPAWLPQRPGP